MDGLSRGAPAPAPRNEPVVPAPRNELGLIIDKLGCDRDVRARLHYFARQIYQYTGHEYHEYQPLLNTIDQMREQLRALKINAREFEAVFARLKEEGRKREETRILYETFDYLIEAMYQLLPRNEDYLWELTQLREMLLRGELETQQVANQVAVVMKKTTLSVNPTSELGGVLREYGREVKRLAAECAQRLAALE